jgi:hypothetical protein
MGRIAQAGFNLEVARRLAELEKLVKAQQQRIEALEAKRGPGRPPNAERNSPRSHRAL